MSNNQLTNVENYSEDKLVFSDVDVIKIPNSSLSFKRININYKNNDGTVGKLIIPTPEIFSFGLQENISQQTNQVNGHTFPLCLYNKDNPTPFQKRFVEVFNDIVDDIENYLLLNKDTLELYDLDIPDLRKFNPLYYKKERGKIVSDSPILYPKVIENKNNILSNFYDAKTYEEIEPLELLNKYCHTTAALVIDNIYINSNKISLQVKLYEAYVSLLNHSFKKLLPRPKPKIRVLKLKP